MEKDFDSWNTEKKHAQHEAARFYGTREVWWCRLGVNIGSEQDGSGERFLRPVVIVCAFGPHTCLVVPLTTSAQKHRLRIFVGVVGDREATALLSQIRVIDTRRLVEKIGFLDKKYFENIRKTIKNWF